jgi:peptide/nickel transport system substrate-binding protein
VILRETFQTRATNNYGRWSNPVVDGLLAAVRVEMDRPARDRAIRDLQRVALEDFALLPTHFQMNVWATRKGLALTPRGDESTLAEDIRPN